MIALHDLSKEQGDIAKQLAQAQLNYLSTNLLDARPASRSRRFLSVRFYPISVDAFFAVSGKKIARNRRAPRTFNDAIRALILVSREIRCSFPNVL